MTAQEAVALALATAQKQGWPEKLRVGVYGGRKFILFGPFRWWVSLESRRANLWAQITISDWIGEVIDITSRPLNPNRKPAEPTSSSDNEAGENKQ
jgi:hypothetical protein